MDLNPNILREGKKKLLGKGRGGGGIIKVGKAEWGKKSDLIHHMKKGFFTYAAAASDNQKAQGQSPKRNFSRCSFESGAGRHSPVARKKVSDKWNFWNSNSKKKIVAIFCGKLCDLAPSSHWATHHWKDKTALATMHKQRRRSRKKKKKGNNQFSHPLFHSPSLCRGLGCQEKKERKRKILFSVAWIFARSIGNKQFPFLRERCVSVPPSNFHTFRIRQTRRGGKEEKHKLGGWTWSPARFISTFFLAFFFFKRMIARITTKNYRNIFLFRSVAFVAQKRRKCFRILSHFSKSSIMHFLPHAPFFLLISISLPFPLPPSKPQFAPQSSCWLFSSSSSLLASDEWSPPPLFL